VGCQINQQHSAELQQLPPLRKQIASLLLDHPSIESIDRSVQITVREQQMQFELDGPSYPSIVSVQYIHSQDLHQQVHAVNHEQSTEIHTKESLTAS
jgi:hypothetical protein